MSRPGSKLIVCSVRLPVSLSLEEGDWIARASPGGLATALRAVAQRRPFTWVGYPGTSVTTEEGRARVTEVLAEGGSVPVFLDHSEVAGFYEELSNRVLWPLFHGLPGPRRFPRDAWDTYRSVNERFADTLADLAEPGDTIWVHDYQLTLVPELLRQRGIDCAIGFFLHIPFPAADIYRTLPVREEIARGMLGADLLGFHTYEYVSSFRASCLRVLGTESEPESMNLASHRAHLGVLPIGIDPDQIAALKRSTEAVGEYEELSRTYEGQKVILGVDRLDYTKGLPHKLLAYEELLDRSPDLRGKVTLIQIAAPSRTGVLEYQELQREIDELVGRINGRYGTLHWTPVSYINQNVPRRRLTALYRIADVALITPVRDGMNLVCLEYIAARGSDAGALILSEFAGAASCLSGARLVNPHNTSQVASALADALTDGPSHEAWGHMREFVHVNTSQAWAKRFLSRLEETRKDERARVEPLRTDRGAVRERVAAARRPLILLDYDGTLRPYTTLPEQASPTPLVRGLLGDLARFGVVYVVSGRPASVLDAWLGDLPIGLVCEHGLGVKHLGQDWHTEEGLDTTALGDIVEPVFRDFAERTPGSKIERKAASVAWHYRAADPTFGAWRAKELRSVLESRLAGLPYSILAGSKVIEVRHVNMTKGRAAAQLLEHHKGTDLVVCFGDDRTDEDMFDAVLRSDRTDTLVCRVGGANTVAPYIVPSSQEAFSQLEKMIAIWRGARG